MSLTDNEPMKYFEIAQGNFDSMMQELFIKGHRMASEFNQKVELSATINIFPPDPRVRESGNVSFSVQLKEPKYTSQKFTTALVGGIPVNEGKSREEAENYNLFDKPKITENNQQKPEVVDAPEHNG